MDLLFLKPRKSDEAGPWEHCGPGAHTRTAFAGFCVDRVHVYKPSVMCSSKFAVLSFNYKIIIIAMLLKTPSDARSRKTVVSAFERTCRQAESVQVKLKKYEDEGVVSDLRYVRSRSVLVEEIESLDRLIHWLEIDLKPDQKWEVPQDRVRAQGLLSLSSRKVCNLKRALIDWDGQTGDEAERYFGSGHEKGGIPSTD